MPAVLGQVVGRALQKDRRARYANAGAMQQELVETFGLIRGPAEERGTLKLLLRWACRPLCPDSSGLHGQPLSKITS